MAEHSQIKEEDIDILFGYKGSRKDCKATHSTLCMCIQQQLHSFGESDSVVLSGSCPEPESSNQEIFLLQKWSAKWNTFVNVDRVEEINDQDRVSVTRKPLSPPSKVCVHIIIATLQIRHQGHIKRRGHSTRNVYWYASLLLIVSRICSNRPL